MQTYAVRLRERGQLTIPQAIREKMAVGQGDILSLVEFDDVLLIAPRQLLIPRLSEEFSRIMEEDGVSMADLLQGLEEERIRIRQER